MVTAKFSHNFEAIRSRIKRLPKMLKKTIQTASKKDAIGLVDEYQKGIKRNNIGLAQLHDFSIEQKEEAGYSNPNTPLYGAGDSLDRTLYNGLIIIQSGNKYIVKFSDKQHHDSKLTINQLHQIHENGAIIVVTEKMRAFLHFIGLHLKASTLIIRIPPRQAWAKAIARYMKKKRAVDTANEVKKAILAFIKTNSEHQLNVIQKYTQREKEILAGMGVEA